MRRASATSAEEALAGATGAGAAAANVPGRRHGGRSVSPPTAAAVKSVARIGDADGVYTTADGGAWYERVWGGQLRRVCDRPRLPLQRNVSAMPVFLLPSYPRPCAHDVPLTMAVAVARAYLYTRWPAREGGGGACHARHRPRCGGGQRRPRAPRRDLVAGTGWPAASAGVLATPSAVAVAATPASDGRRAGVALADAQEGGRCARGGHRTWRHPFRQPATGGKAAAMVNHAGA